jgi:hypothetical protein
MTEGSIGRNLYISEDSRLRDAKFCWRAEVMSRVITGAVHKLNEQLMYIIGYIH